MSVIELEHDWETKLDVDIHKTEIEPHLTASERVFVVAGYDLYVLDTDDGAILKQLDHELDPTILSPIAIDEEVCYLPISWGIPDGNGEVWAFEYRTGAMRWEIDVDVSVNGGVVESNGTVFAARGSDPIAVDAETSRVKWIFDDTDHWFNETTAIETGNNQFYITTPGYSDTGMQSGELFGLDSKSGELQWRVTNETERYEPYHDCIHLASGDEVLAATQYDAKTRTGRVRGLDPATGEEQWRWSDDNSFQPVSLVTAAHEGVVCVASENETVGIDSISGDELWRYETAGGKLVSVGELVFVADRRYIHLIDVTGGIAYETLEPNTDQVQYIGWFDGSLYYVTTRTNTKVGAYETNYKTDSQTGNSVDDDRCPDCDANLTGDETFCPECGIRLPEKEPECPSCSSELTGDESFCPECGHELK